MEKNDNSYAYNIAYAKIKEMLFNLKIKPGDNISELMLSKELGLSRTPIREAMRTLEQEGLIVSITLLSCFRFRPRGIEIGFCHVLRC